MKKTYDKTPLSFKEQIHLLKTRGLIIENEMEAEAYLKHVNYYRLSAYFLLYQKEKDCFNNGTTFNLIQKHYGFDRELRLLVLDAIERVEIAIRTQITHVLALKHQDSHWQDDESLFKEPYYDSQVESIIKPYQNFQDIIKKAKRAKHPELFIKHYSNKYSEPENPPAWACIELLTIGQLSRLYNGLKSNEDKKDIANNFSLETTVFSSWFHTLSYMRNLCAHHSRLWNRDLAIEPLRFRNKKGKIVWLSDSYQDNKRVFYSLSILKHFLDVIYVNHDFKNQLASLFARYAEVDKKYMGIPMYEDEMVDWKNEPLWEK